jgi:uncharacterized membrane protein YeaQ/YmgE (transglycosylase-associated protein family)
MNITLSDVIVWLVVGAIVGPFIGMVFKQKKEGYGLIANLFIGLIGALIGGVAVRAFNIDMGLGDLSVSFQDLIAAVAGSLVFLFVIWIIRRRLKREKG